MLKYLLPVLLVISSCYGAESLPWIGVSFDRSDASARAASGLRSGVGLSVSSVVDSGPLGRGGGKKGDFWWKMDGQILVNRCQLVVLLRERKVGDRVKIGYFREGKLEQLSVVLSNRPRPDSYLISARARSEELSRKLESSVEMTAGCTASV